MHIVMVCIGIYNNDTNSVEKYIAHFPLCPGYNSA